MSFLVLHPLYLLLFLYQISHALHFTSIYKFHHIFAPKIKIYDGIMKKMGTLLPSERWKSSNPSTRKVVFLTYKFSSSPPLPSITPGNACFLTLPCSPFSAQSARNIPLSAPKTPTANVLCLLFTTDNIVVFCWYLFSLVFFLAS